MTDLSSKDIAVIIACNFALCSGPTECHVDWPSVPLYSSGKESDNVPLFEKQPLVSILAKVSPPPADVQQYCSALLLPLLRSSPSIGSELLADRIKNHLVDGQLPSLSLLPPVIAALAGAVKLTAVDVAHIVVSHILPLAADAPCKLHVSLCFTTAFLF